jgi:D-alanyl-D-alanine carboxypeptidase
LSELGIPADYGSRRGLVFQAEASELVAIGTNTEGREIQVTPAAAAAWGLMKDRALSEGVVLVAHSGFRSIARQEELIRAKIARGQPIDAILKVMAAPGFSEHHTGNAIDIGVPDAPPLTEDFEGTGAFLWLGSHAKTFGFRLSYPRDNAHGIVYEPWHWFYTGSS